MPTYSNSVMVAGRDCNVFLYNPMIFFSTSAAWFDLPQPVESTTEEYSMDIRTVKIPLQDGIRVIDVSRGPLTLSLSGKIVKDTHGEVLEVQSYMQQMLTRTPESFTFYRYYDGAGYGIYYANCYCSNLVFTPTTRTVNYLPYTLSILVPDGKERTQGTYSPRVDEGGDSGIGDGSGVVWDDYQHRPGPLRLDLGHNTGPNALIIEDSTGQTVAKFTTDGDILYTGFAEQVDSISV